MTVLIAVWGCLIATPPAGAAPTTFSFAACGPLQRRWRCYAVSTLTAVSLVAMLSAWSDSALAASHLADPVPASVIVTHTGLDWVWASPCSQGGCTSGILVGKDGFEFATSAQWALRPEPSAFVDKCASPWFDLIHNHCDITLGEWGSAPKGGLPAGPDGTTLMGHLFDTWLVRTAVLPPYDFTGFGAPVNNPPMLNKMNAGRAVPVKFSLNGYQGPDIMAVGSPSSQQIDCNTGSADDEVEETSSAGSSSLSYDAGSDQYTYVWKTDSAWADTCRQLNVTLSDGTTHTAKFKFT